MISIVTPTYNEKENVAELHRRIGQAMKGIPYDYEHICVDNASTDGTLEILTDLAKTDARLKIIVNARNVGYIRSSFHGLLQARGDAVILLASDLQDPPELIPQLVEKWEAGHKTVLCVKKQSDESRVVWYARRAYYAFLSSIAEAPLVNNSTGSGLFDRQVIEVARKINDPYPYFRGLVTEIGLSVTTVEFHQPRRKGGTSTQSLYRLLDFALLGIVKHSRVPLRFIAVLGIVSGLVSVLAGIGYLTAKLVFWDAFELGVAPLIVGVFFLGSLQLVSLGLLGEYVLSIHTHVRGLPHVVEAQRINFDAE